MKPSAKKRILLVDDHPLLRQGISQLVNEQADLMVCAETGDSAGALAAVESSKPDLAVIDISLKGQSGLDLVKQLKARFPGVATLVLSMHDESLYAERALRAGARGYIMKREAALNVLEAIRHILDGHVYVSSRINAAILDKVSGGTGHSTPTPMETLSDRELEVLTLIGKGHGVQQIAGQLHISIKTVEAHRASIKLKLNLESSQALLQFAIQWTQSSAAE